MSPVTIVGNYPYLNRLRTGLFSLDRALANRGELGLPLRTMTEIYGYPNVGKSTLSYYLASKCGPHIAICDLELLDRTYLAGTLESYGYDGEVHLMEMTDEKKKPIPHEKMLMAMAAHLYKEEYGSAVVDSVGAIQPIAEAEGDFGEAFMGKRAKLVAQVCRATSNALRNKDRPSAAFFINHVMGILGGKGHTTPGGDTLKFLAAQRLMLWTKETFPQGDKPQPPYGFLVGGQVEKLRNGGRGKSFQFYIVPGYGVHAGASALFDCIALGLAERGSKLKLDGKNVGYLQADFLSSAADGYTGKKFDIFEDALAEYELKLGREVIDDKQGERDEDREAAEDNDVSAEPDDFEGTPAGRGRAKRARRVVSG